MSDDKPTPQDVKRYASDVDAWVAAGCPKDAVPVLGGVDILDFKDYRPDPHYDNGGSPQ
jgi:hypothetical protein